MQRHLRVAKRATACRAVRGPLIRRLSSAPLAVHRFGKSAAASHSWEYTPCASGRIEARPLVQHEDPLARVERAAGTAVAYFLPQGFPASVGPDYLPYCMWNSAHMALGSAAGVLSTQALLAAVGVGQAAALPIAASLNWVLKDGLGQLAAVLAAATISNRFDADPKRWRLTAAMCECSARVVEVATPFFPGCFLLLASVANLGKSIACVAASATKADFHRALTRERNLGDVTGKAGSQAAACELTHHPWAHAAPHTIAGGLVAGDRRVARRHHARSLALGGVRLDAR